MAGDVQRVMPLDVERKLVDGLLIAQIVHLLQDHGTHHGDQFIRGASYVFAEMLGEQMYRKDWPNVVTEHSCSGALQHLLAFLPQIAKRVEHVAGFVVFDVYPAISR